MRPVDNTPLWRALDQDYHAGMNRGNDSNPVRENLETAALHLGQGLPVVGWVFGAQQSFRYWEHVPDEKMNGLRSLFTYWSGALSLVPAAWPFNFAMNAGLAAIDLAQAAAYAVFDS